jgi:hypothetical protein
LHQSTRKQEHYSILNGGPAEREGPLVDELLVGDKGKGKEVPKQSRNVEKCEAREPKDVPKNATKVSIITSQCCFFAFTDIP